MTTTVPRTDAVLGLLRAWADADWLDEQGEPELAELIRVQVELAGLSPPQRVRLDRVIAAGESGGYRVIARLRTAGTGMLDVGRAYDLEEPTSRLSARWHRDMRLVGWSPRRDDVEASFVRGEPWPDRPRYDALLTRQHRLLCYKDGDGPVPWGAWCYAPWRDEEGVPAGDCGRGGMRIYPARDDHFPWVEVPPRLRQTFRRGLVAEVRCDAAEWVRHGPELVRHPLACVERVTFRDKRPGTPDPRHLGYKSGMVGWYVTRPTHDDPDDLPPPVYGRLPDPMTRSELWKLYPDEAAAWDAASKAALLYAWETAPCSASS